MVVVTMVTVRCGRLRGVVLVHHVASVGNTAPTIYPMGVYGKDRRPSPRRNNDIGTRATNPLDVIP